jgi:hypothetical protein
MNKHAFFLIFFFGFLVSYVILRGQQQPAMKKKQERGNIRLMFYNTENFFDIVNDTLYNDEEYLPTAVKKWNYAKYLEKTRNIFQVIAATG